MPNHYREKEERDAFYLHCDFFWAIFRVKYITFQK